MKRTREETLVMQNAKRAHSVAELEDEIVFEHDGLAQVRGEMWFSQLRVARIVEQALAAERIRQEEDKQKMRQEFQAHMDAVQLMVRDQVARADNAVAQKYADLYIN